MKYIIIGGSEIRGGMPNAPYVRMGNLKQKFAPLDNGALLIGERCDSVYASKAHTYVLYGELEEYRGMSDYIVEERLDYSEAW